MRGDAAMRRPPSWGSGWRRSASWPASATGSGSRPSTQSAAGARGAASRRGARPGPPARGLWLRDVACLRWEAQELVHHVDRLDALAEDAEGRDPQRLCAGVELVEETRRRLRSNVSEELALEALAYRLESLLAG